MNQMCPIAEFMKKNTKVKKTAKQGNKSYAAEKEYRLSSLRMWIDKYTVYLGNYLFKTKEAVRFLQSKNAECSAEAAKKELCNALRFVKISLEHLDTRNPSEIENGWRDLTNLSGIDKKLKDFEKQGIIKGRTEKMIYELYAILHCCHLKQKDSPDNVNITQHITRLKNLSNKFGLAMRLSGATIYQVKAPFRNLIEFLAKFLGYSNYFTKNDDTNLWKGKSIVEVRNDVRNKT